MRSITTLFRLIVFSGMLGIAGIERVSGAELFDYPIVLDPLCKTPEMVNPPLLPGNPAPGTRRMAQRLEEALQKTPRDAIPFMSERIIPLLEEQLTNTTQLNDKIPGNTNHWVKLKLVGTKSNRPAIGLVSRPP